MECEINDTLTDNQIISEKKNKQMIIICLLLLLTVAIFLISISIGSVNIKIEDVVNILLGNNVDNETFTPIVINIRLPRAIATILGGACLSISGLLLQIFFRNPIVEPYVLGISSGATLFVGLVVLGGYTFGLSSVTPMFLFTGAFIGAMLVMLAVVCATKRVKNITTLLIIGIMAGFICSAVTSILTAFADKEKITGYLMWTMGSFSGFSWTQVKYLALIGIPFIVITFFISKPLNAMLFGEKYAISMGLNIKAFRIIIIIISSILTAVITAFAGPISFVGLAVPHIVRITFSTSDNKVLIPAVIVSGALMMCLCDLGARMLLSPIELPLGALTSLIGAPIVLYLLLRKENAL